MRLVGNGWTLTLCLSLLMGVQHSLATDEIGRSFSKGEQASGSGPTPKVSIGCSHPRDYLPIVTVDDLISISHTELEPNTNNYWLCNDLTLPSPDPGSVNFSGIKEFAGIFEGNGHQIEGMVSGNGMFLYLTGSVLNLTLRNSTVNPLLGSQTAPGFTGVVAAGVYEGGKIIGVHVAGASEIHSTFAGGIAGTNAGLIDGCTVSVTISYLRAPFHVSTHFYAGGIAANNSGVVRNASVGGTINATPSMESQLRVLVGGAIGRNWGRVSNVRSTTSISLTATEGALGGLVGESLSSAIGSTTSGVYRSSSEGDLAAVFQSYGSETGEQLFAAGGLIGRNSLRIEDSYSRGAVSVVDDPSGFAGGLVGKNFEGSGVIQRTFSTGMVTISGAAAAGSVGALIASNTGVPVENSYWLLAPNHVTESDGGSSRTHLQMTTPGTPETFTGWPEDVWLWIAGAYPELL